MMGQLLEEALRERPQYGYGAQYGQPRFGTAKFRWLALGVRTPVGKRSYLSDRIQVNAHFAPRSIAKICILHVFAATAGDLVANMMVSPWSTNFRSFFDFF